MRWIAVLMLAAVLVATAVFWLVQAGRGVVAAPEGTPVQVGSAADAELRAPLAPVPTERVEMEREEAEPSEPDVQEDIPPEVEGSDEPDPVQLGPAMLDLRLTDARTGAPVSSWVELWRIDAPGNEHWTEGDQQQQSAHVPEEGWLFTRLPEGRYRLVCSEATWNAQPPEVTVSAPRTKLDVPIDVPGFFRLRVVVRDRYGRLVPSVYVQREQPKLLQLSEPWRFERTPRDGSGIWEDEEYSEDPSPRTGVGPQPEDGFDLGQYRGAQRGSHLVQGLTLETPEGARVHVLVPAQAEGDIDLVAVAVSPDDVLPGIRILGAAVGEPKVEVTGEAVLARPGLSLGGWDHAPVRIVAELDGCQSQVVGWTVADGDLPAIELEPAH